MQRYCKSLGLGSELSSTPQDLKKYGATTVVRVCEVTYDKAPLEKDGITVVVRVEARESGCPDPGSHPPHLLRTPRTLWAGPPWAGQLPG